MSRGKALWPYEGRNDLRGLAWMDSLCGGEERPLLTVNTFALARRGQCAVLLPLFDPTVWPHCGVGCVSHKAGTAAAPRAAIDSA